MPMEMKNTGYVPPHKTPLGGPDPRNHLVASASPIASSVMTDIKALPILNQKKTPSCVAHAVVKLITYLIWKKTGRIVKLSPRFLYALCKAHDGMPNTEGTTPLIALKMAQKYGVCEDSFFPNNTDLDLATYQNIKLAPTEAFGNALQYRIGEYQFLGNTTESALQAAIEEYELVMVGITISDSWWTDAAGNVTWDAAKILPLRPPHTADPSDSNHLIIMNGFDSSMDYMAHDWSPLWAAQGYGWFGRNDVPFIYEGAVIKDVNYPPPAPPVPPVVVVPPPVNSPIPVDAKTGLLITLWNKVVALLRQIVLKEGGNIS